VVVTPRRCFCCRLELCECGPEPCWECGACGFHCTCPRGFVACECRRVDVDVDDARDCPVHGGRRTARFRTSRHRGRKTGSRGCKIGQRERIPELVRWERTGTR
jgi:hypothetical protein